MGYESVRNINHVELKNLSGGWFPGKPFNDIPGNLDAGSTVGASDCDNVAWYRGALRKLFGYTQLTTTALNSGAPINSIFYSHILDTVVGNAGNKLYDGLDAASPTDITGSLTISASELVCWTEWSFGGSEYVLGSDGTNPIFQYDGTGTASVVAGTPPVGKYITVWQNVLWVADGDTLRFSAIGDFTSWDVDDNYRFDAPIRGIGRLNKQLVVFFDDHIGVLEGDNNRLLTSIIRFVDGVGCSSHFTIKNARLSNTDVLVFHANDGIYAYDGSQVIVKLSFPIEEKYTNNSNTTRWNHAVMGNSVSVYDINFDWYYTAMAEGSSVTNNTLLIQDLKRRMDLPTGISVPHWPCKNLNKSVTYMEFSRSLDKRGILLIGTTEGLVYKMDESVFTRDGQSYSASYTTKVFDNTVTHIVQELNILGEINSNASIDVYINSTLSEGLGGGGRISFEEDADLLSLTFVLGESTLGGGAYALKHAPTNSYGRYLQFTINSVSSSSEMVVLGIDLVLNNIGLQPNADQGD